MEYLRLDQIEEDVKTQRIKIFLKLYASEILKFAVFVAFMVIFGIVFVNRNAFKMYSSDILWINLWWTASFSTDKLAKDSSQRTKIVEIWDAGAFDKKQEKYLEIINSKFSNIWVRWDKDFTQPDINKYLKDKLRNYKFDFNLLPPDNRIMIPEIGVDAPISDVNLTDVDKIEKADYDTDLYKWVVRYPDTSMPWQEGDALIFWHTSYYWWKKNPYWEVFAKIPKLEQGSLIQVLRNGKVYEYEVIDKTISNPKDVSKHYSQYKKGKYLTIMWCYPIGTDARRMMITAKLKMPQTLSYNK